MAHSCRNCGCNKIDCGCKDSYLTTPPPCPTPEDCPDAQPCSEVFDAECIIYNGTPLTCAETTIVPTGMSVAEALDRIIDYFCRTTGTDTIVAAGNNITVSSTTVGNTTTYTVAALCAPFVEISVTQGGNLQATVSGGKAPYTYVWSMADNWLAGNTQSMFTLNATIQPNVVAPVIFPVNPTDPNTFTFAASFGGRVGLAKVVVTDANGCKASDTYLLLYGVVN